MENESSKMARAIIYALATLFQSKCDRLAAVTSLILTDLQFNKKIRDLLNASEIVLGDHLGIQVCTSGKVQSVSFYINHIFISTENDVPYTLACEKILRYLPWLKSNTGYKITAIPYPEKNGKGVAGYAKTIIVKLEAAREWMSVANP